MGGKVLYSGLSPRAEKLLVFIHLLIDLDYLVVNLSGMLRLIAFVLHIVAKVGERLYNRGVL